MGISSKLKSAVKDNGYMMSELAEYLGLSRQSLSNKFKRESFSAEDLIKIATFLGGELVISCDKGRFATFAQEDIDQADINK